MESKKDWDALLSYDSERARAKKHDVICATFAELRVKYPEVAIHRLMKVIAEEEGYSLSGVRKILVRKGIVGQSGNRRVG